jgi:hypothetical protein
MRPRINWDDIFEKCIGLFYELPDGADVTIELNADDFDEILIQRKSTLAGRSIVISRQDQSLKTKILLKPKRVSN